MKAVICGAGIAGLTTALCLQRNGHEVVVVERASALRNEGYMIDFFGPGFDACERLGLLPDLERIHYLIANVAFADANGADRLSLQYPVMRKRLFGNRHFNFMRGELEQVLFERQPVPLPVCFGASVESIEQRENGVTARLTNGQEVRCDVLIGADGLHSRVRKLVFGDEKQFLRFLGFYTAAYILPSAVPGMRTDEFRIVTVPGKQAGVYPIRGGRTATYFVHRADIGVENFSRASAEEELRRVYGGLGWVVPELLNRMPDAGDIYFDSVSQIVMSSWHKGRVVLVGDAAWCVSLLAGQGASMAVGGAYVLSEELSKSAHDIPAALAAYEGRVRAAVEKKQASGRNIARWFVPESEFGLSLRDFFLRTSMWPGLSWFVRRQFSGDSFL